MGDPVPFLDLAAKFPKDMPAEQYDAYRRQYFDNIVKPRLGAGDNPLGAWERFKQNTNRESTLSPVGKIALPGAQAMLGVVHAISKPAASLMKEDPTIAAWNKRVEANEKSLVKAARREGRSTLPTAAGELAGSIVPFALASETAGASMGGLVEEGTMTWKLIHGGLSMSAFEAANAEDGGRLTAGAKGFGVGLAFEGALGMAGKLLRKGVPADEVDGIVKRALTTGEIPPEIDEEIAKQIRQDSRGSKSEGRPAFINEDPKVSGINIFARDGKGKPVTLELESSHGVPDSGAMAKVMSQIKRLTEEGGQVDGIIHHPDEGGVLNQLLRQLSDNAAPKYEGAKVVRTAENQARAISLDENLSDKPTAPVGDSEIVRQDPARTAPKPDEINNKVKTFKDEEGYELSRGAQMQIQRGVSALWDPAVSTERKEMVADQLKHWELGDLIPEEWRRDKPIGEPAVSAEEKLNGDLMSRAEELGLSEAELNRLQEIAEKEPSRIGGERFEPGLGETPQASARVGTEEGAARDTALFQQARQELGEGASLSKVAQRAQELKQAAEREPFVIPESERGFAKMTEDGPTWEKVEGRDLGESAVKFGARQVAVKASDIRIQSVLPGAEAFVVPPEQAATYYERLGLEPPKPGSLDRGPMVVYQQGVKRSTAYHEGLHVDGYHIVDGKRIMQFTDGLNEAAYSIGKGLSKHSAYAHAPVQQMQEEAFVHAATAIRMGDVNAFANLVAMDHTTQDVIDMVYGRAEKLLMAARESVDSAQARIVQRKMDDLILRTSGFRSWELRMKAHDLMSDMWYDPASKTWNSLSVGDVAEQFMQDYKSGVDNLMAKDGTDFAPSETLWAEARGVRGPFTPRGGSPVKEPVAMDTPPDTRWSGWTTISGLFRPMQPWVADLHTRVNSALESSGRKLPIFQRWKDVDDAFRAGETWMHDKYASSADLLEGLGKKQYDYFNVLTTDQRHWPEMARQLNLGQEDLTKIQKINDWLMDFQNETHIPVFNYLKDDLPRLRQNGYNTERVYGTLNVPKDKMSTFNRLISSGELDPKAQHIGSFMNTVMREGFNQKYANKPIAALEQLINQKAKNGEYVLGNMRKPLENYTRYMKGIPDVTGQVMNKTVSDMTKFLGKQAEHMNKHLPDFAQLPTEYQYPKAILNKLMTWSYAAGLGLRASIPIRDAMQVFSTALPVLGPKKFLLGMMKGLSKEGYSFAEEMGATLRSQNVGEMFGDVFYEIPPDASKDKITKLANKLLAPSRMGHNVGRNIVFNGEYHSALPAIRAYRAGHLPLDELIKEHTSLWWNDKPLVDRIVGQLHDPGFSDHEIARNIALETTDLTLWPYRRGTQPTLLRTGAGRVFGQFGMWPTNYLDFLKRGAAKYAEHPGKALQTTALWAASNYAAVSAMNGIGADSGKWFWFSPAAIDMSPHAKFIEDLAMSPKDSPDGREARRRVLEYPLNFFPTGIELKNIYSVWENDESPFDDDGAPTPALLKVLGFKPLKEVPEKDLEDEIKFQMGYGKERKHF